MSQTSELAKEFLAKAGTRFGKRQVAVLERALTVATNAHEGQKRGTGEPYVTHSVSVAYTLLSWNLDAPTVAAALLHDVPEDTAVTLPELAKDFGDEIAGLVEAVTKLSVVRLPKDDVDYQAENLRRLFLAMAKDVRVVLLKLADRLHNMTTLKGVKPEKRRRIALETLEVYAPLADRLGMGEVRSELDDLGFRYAEPKEYEWTKRQVQQTHLKQERYAVTVKREFQDVLKAEGINSTINARTKNLYSLYRKLLQKERDIEQIYDFFAVRVIVATVEDCYQGMGVIHQHWQPLPHRMKDYIAVPKLNGYRSLHTTVFGPHDRLLEVQFRTKEMHEEAELGIAAHAVYAEDKESVKAGTEQLAVMRQLASWQEELAESPDFSRFKLDLFSKRVFVFTPKGAVHSLPAGSTPVDFAYTVHSEVGSSCVGAKVNGVIVPLDTVLRNGDVVEILTQSNSVPKRDWLGFVRTGAARTNIRTYFRHQAREDNAVAGKDLFDQLLKKHDRGAKSLTGAEDARLLKLRQGIHSREDLFAALGEGTLSTEAVARALKLESSKPAVKPSPTPSGRTVKQPRGLTVEGGATIASTPAMCCKPKAGDRVVGYITVGRGISIHRRDCPQVAKLPDRSRIVAVSWKSR